MRTAYLLLAFISLILHASNTAKASEDFEKLMPTLLEWSKHPDILNAIREANSVFKTQQQINAIDKEWQDYAGISPLMLSMLDSQAAQTLLSFERSAPYFQEIFITDKYGANVAMTSKTSDYWQGDELKFTRCIKNEAVYIGSREYDMSAAKDLIQISIPIFDGTDIIGVMVIGINPLKLEE